MNRLQRWFSDRFVAPAVKAQIPLSTLRGWSSMGWGNALTSATKYADDPTGWIAAAHNNVWANNCIKARSAAIAQTPLKLYVWNKAGDEEEVEDHPILDLLETVNPINSNRISFKRMLETQLSIHGDCIVRKVRNGGGNRGEMRELYIMPRQYVEPMPSDETFIAHYKWMPSGDKMRPEDVLRFWYPHPDGGIYGESPTSSALRYINSYNIADMAAEGNDRRGGQGGGIVSYDPIMLGTDWQRLKDEWNRIYSDPNNAGMDHHMPPGTHYESGALTAVQMQREERMARLGKSIMGCYSVPPANAGDYSDASVLANAAMQDKSFWQLWAIAEQDFIAETLNNDLLWSEYKGTYEAGLFLQFDRTEVTALAEDADAKVNRAVVLFQGGLSSLNEARELAELPNIDVPEADAVAVTVAQGAKLFDVEKGEEVVDEEPEPDPVTTTPVQPFMNVGTTAALEQPVAPVKATMRIVDFVGMKAITPDGEGVIEAIKRFGEYGDMTATKAQPVVIVNGKPYAVDVVEVLSGEG